jgi:hypothetical protein
MVVHTCNSTTRKATEGGPGVQGHSELHSEFQVILDHTVRHCLKKPQDTKEMKRQASDWEKIQIIYLIKDFY